jgi:hypothetical protein
MWVITQATGYYLYLEIICLTMPGNMLVGVRPWRSRGHRSQPALRVVSHHPYGGGAGSSNGRSRTAEHLMAISQP